MSRPSEITPPKWPGTLICWICGEFVAEDMLGDLHEMYLDQRAKSSKFISDLQYIWQVITLLASSALWRRRRQEKFHLYNRSVLNIAVIGSYTKVAYRGLLKQKFFSIVNILGMSVGMSIGLMAVAAYLDVLEVDTFHTNSEHIYRVTTHVDNTDLNRSYASSSLPLADMLRDDKEGIQKVIRFNRDLHLQVRKGSMSIPLNGYYTDKRFFEMFSFELISGNINTALSLPRSLVITPETATKLFGDMDPLNRIIMVDGFGEFTITGIIDDSKRSHLLFDALTSFETLEQFEKSGLLEKPIYDIGPVTNNYVYVEIADAEHLESVQASLDQFAKDNQDGTNFAGVTFGLQALSNIPKDDLYNEIGLGWGYLALLMFFLVSLLILIPACLNYANISIARAIKRGKEIGLRKVVGGQREQIFVQFLIETILVSLVSLLGAVYLFVMIRAEFLAMIVQGSRTFDFEINGITILMFLGFAIFTGLIAGIVPAIYFSKLTPIQTLRTSSRSSKLSRIGMRHCLFVVEFSLSIVFTLGVSILIKQYKYALNMDMGFEKENILDIPLRGANPDMLRNALTAIPEVSNISMSSDIPGIWYVGSSTAKGTNSLDSVQVYQMFVDKNYINNLDVSLIAGNTFPEVTSRQEEYIIVNKEFVNKFNYKDPYQILEEVFLIDDGIPVRVIGVIENFKYMSVKDRVESFYFRYDPAKFAYANVKLATSDIQSTLNKLEQAWKTVVPDQKFEARFLQHELEDALVSYINLVKIFGFLGFLSIVISCLGLLAMVVFSAENRLKEMGVRKVLGAGSFDLAFSLSGGFLKMLGISILIAVPIGYLLFDQVILGLHHYRAEIGFTEVGIAIFLVMILSGVTIFSQVIKVARVNPVDYLKYE